ncbi:hypothetical protein ACKU2X_025695 [Klebsiella pneumoniae]
MPFGESIIAPYRENGEGIKMMDAIEKLLFVSEEAKKMDSPSYDEEG